MITEKRSADALILKLEGTLAGDWADVGKGVLSLMIKEGVEIIARDILTKSIVEEIANQSAVAQQ